MAEESKRKRRMLSGIAGMGEAEELLSFENNNNNNNNNINDDFNATCNSTVYVYTRTTKKETFQSLV